MASSQTSEKLTRLTLEQHQQVQFFLDQLEKSIRALDEIPGNLEPLRRLPAELEIFRERLEAHQKEEESGLFKGIVDELPAAEPEIMTLCDQHDRMIEILAMATIHARNVTVSEVRDLQEDLQDFLEMIRDHETAEGILLKRAVDGSRG